MMRIKLFRRSERCRQLIRHGTLMALLLVLSVSPLVGAFQDSTNLKNVIPVGQRNEGLSVVDIEVKGNQQIPTDVILGQMVTQVGALLSMRQLQEDVDAIDQLGFFVTLTEYELENASGKVKVIVRVVEYETIEDIAVEGNTVVSDETIVSILSESNIKKGSIYNNLSMRISLENVRAYYIKKGIEIVFPKLEFDPVTHVVTFQIHEPIVGEIQIVGLKKTRNKTITRELRLREGGIYDFNLIMQDVQNLRNLPFIRDAEFLPKRYMDDARVMHVYRVEEEENQGRANAGLGFSSRNELVGALALEHSNFLGRGDQISLQGRFLDRKGYTFKFKKNWIDSKGSSLSFSVFDDNFLRSQHSGMLFGNVGGDRQYREDRQGMKLVWQRPLDEQRRSSIQVGIRNEKVSFELRNFGDDSNTDNESLELDQAILDQGRVVSIPITYIRDTRDFFLNPSRGSRQSITVDVAPRILGGGRAFQRFEVDLRHYVPLQKIRLRPGRTPRPARDVLAFQLLAGTGLGELPKFENFFVGGAESLRGYGEDHAMGRNMLILRMEERHQFSGEIQGVLFADVGDAFDSGFDPKIGYGLGVRLFTRFAVLRLDLGFGEQGREFHFSIGPTF